MIFLVTGSAGFIGFHVAQYLLDRGEQVIGIDNLNPYYDVALKQARLARLEGREGFSFQPVDVADPAAMTALVERHPDIATIIHLAAQAGVRYSLTQPLAYVEANVKGQVVLLEAARKLAKLKSIVYASSSSVYGANTKQPFSIEDRADHRPDMAAYLFTDAILAGRPIRVFNAGQMSRDFTYIDDIVPAIVAAAETAPARPGEHRLYNLGNNRPEALLDFIGVLEKALGRSATRQMMPMQPGDVPTTYADIEPAKRDLGFAPRIPIAVGLPRFVAWYREYHGLNEPTPGVTP